MSNPWLTVPLNEYEQHMSSAEVQQLGSLSDLFAEAIGRCRPLSVAVLGVAGGNGLDHIDSSITSRVVGLDLNPRYLEAVRERYSHLGALELHCVDLSEQHLELEPVQLVHAALIFEHAGTGRCLDNAISLVIPGGNLSVVLQLPAENGEMVGTSPFSSIQRLKSHFSLISSASLGDTLARRGFRLIHQTTRALPAGKGFWAGIFSAPEGHHSKRDQNFAPKLDGKAKILVPRDSMLETPPQIELRDALPADAVALAAIHRSARAAAMPWLPVLHTPEEDVAFFQHRVLPRTTTRLLLVSTRPVAFISYLPGWVEHIYVAPEYWRRGLGTRLIRLAQEAQDQLQLWTFQRNRIARAFYAKAGFKEAELTDGSGNEEHEPDVRLVWLPS